MRERRSTERTCSSSSRSASRRSIPRPARCWPRSPPPATAAIRAWRGPKGSLWVGQYRARKIHQVDPETGTILRTIESNRFVTGVTWAGDELWHGTWEGDESELRRIDPQTGHVLEELKMPPGTAVSGLEFDGGDRFFCGGGHSGKVRAVRRPRRAAAAERHLEDSVGGMHLRWGRATPVARSCGAPTSSGRGLPQPSPLGIMMRTWRSALQI